MVKSRPGCARVVPEDRTLGDLKNSIMGDFHWREGIACKFLLSLWNLGFLFLVNRCHTHCWDLTTEEGVVEKVSLGKTGLGCPGGKMVCLLTTVSSYRERLRHMGRAEQSKFNTLWTLRPNSFQRKHFTRRRQRILLMEPWLEAQPSNPSSSHGCRPSWTPLYMWGSAQVASLLRLHSVAFASGNSLMTLG